MEAILHALAWGGFEYLGGGKVQSIAGGGGAGGGGQTFCWL